MDGGDGKARSAAATIGIIAIVALMFWSGSRTGDEGLAVWPIDLIWVFATSAPLALAWLLAACGYGWAIRAWLLRGVEGAGFLQIGFGVAAMLWLDAALGVAGMLQAAGGAGAWITVAVGLFLLVWQIIRNRRAVGGRAGLRLPHPLFWCSAPAIAVLLTAACSAPGWLWTSEFGGYDALSYHLQLPAEWMTLGAIRPLEHNVYSFLPGYVEAAHYHLALMRGDAIEAAYAAQLLHAFITIAAAVATGQLVRKCAASERAGAMAAIVVLGTPWTIVVGSLAYNEMYVALFLACGGIIAMDPTLCPRERGFAVGLLAGAAVGAKLTAAGFVVAPLGAFILATTPFRQWPAVGGFAAVSCIAVLSLYFIRNEIAAGNPVFPFAPEVFGRGHWTGEQFDTWKRGHISGISLSTRFAEVWHQLLRYGIGAPPSPDEPWRPQWSILFWLGMAGAAVAMVRKPQSRCAIGLTLAFLLQLSFWMFFTHLRSRFMLPAVVPLAGLAVLGTFAVVERATASPRRTWSIILAAAGLIWCAQPGLLFLSENAGAPAARIGMTDLMTGRMHERELARASTDSDRLKLLESAESALYINSLLPGGSRTLLIGDATPFYYTGPIAYQTTWDRGPMSDAMRISDDPARVLAHVRAQGITHVLVNMSMLARWEESGWNDPLITAERILTVLEAGGRRLRDWDVGAVRLYVLSDAP